MDPRVKWTAEFAARSFEVTVLGFNREDRSNPPSAVMNGYRIVRLPRVDVAPEEYFEHLKEIMGRPILAVAMLLRPGASAAKAFGAWVATARRLLADRIPWRFEPNWPRSLARRLIATWRPAQQAPDKLTAIPADEQFAAEMRRIRTRAHYVMGLMRMQFSPATSLFWGYIHEMDMKPDVVHCNDLETLLVGALAKKYFGCRVVYDAHEYYPYCDPYGRWLDIKFFGFLEWLLLRHVDAAVTVNPALARIMSEAYGKSPIYSVPNAEPAVDIEVRPCSSVMTELAAGRLKCLFQGRYSPRRGTEEIILGWQHVDPTKAALFLRGPSNVYTEQAKELAKSLGLLDKSVYFLDSVTEDLLVPAAAEADVGIVPYLPEFLIYQFSCPNKLSQYMHANLMILTNDLSYVRSVVEEAQAGLVYNSNRPETVGQAINCVADDRELLARYKANAKLYARETFNWQNYMGVFDALYRGVEPEVGDSPAQPLTRVV
jgi:glycosyltransferase involved in cell wall biosynthesis